STQQKLTNLDGANSRNVVRRNGDGQFPDSGGGGYCGSLSLPALEFLISRSLNSMLGLITAMGSSLLPAPSNSGSSPSAVKLLCSAWVSKPSSSAPRTSSWRPSLA